MNVQGPSGMPVVSWLEAGNSVLKSHHVIANFSKILRTSIHDRSRFRGEQFTQCCLCAFDLA